MKLLADEGVDQPVVDRLREDGYSVIYITESNPGATDDTVLNLANSVAAVLVTADKDFGELVYRLQRISKGIVLIRLPGLTAAAKAKIVSLAIKAHNSEIENAFTVISANNIRVRRLEQ